METSKQKKHILVISQYFFPEQFRINDICMEWVKRGYEVTVVTGIPNYPQGKFYAGYGLRKKRAEVWNGINIIRIPIVPRGNNAIGLALNYVSFVISGFFWKCFTNIKADVVFNYEVSPMTQALVGVWYAKKRKIPCHLYVTDLWPDNVEIVTGIHNKTFLGIIGKMVDYIYRNSTKIFTSSRSFVRKIHERGVEEEKLVFWPQYAEDFYKPYENVENEDISELTGIKKEAEFQITFAGNIGYAQGLEVVVEAATILKTKGCNACFNIIGDGRYKSQMLADVEKRDVKEYFNFIDRQPAEKIPMYMKASDAALVCLSKSDVFAMTIPAKLQSCLACGIPVIVSADGEVGEIVKEAKCGVISPSGDATSLAENVMYMASLNSSEQTEWMKDNAQKHYVQNFDKNKLLDMMDDFFV